MKIRLTLLLVAALGAIGTVYAFSDDTPPAPTSSPSSTTSSTTSPVPGRALPGGTSDAVAVCDAQSDTVAMSDCFTRLRSDLERQLEDVVARLEASLLNLETNPELAETPEAEALAEIRADLANSQEAWDRYRDTACHAAVLYAIGGTFRNVVGPRCDVLVLEGRIRALEESFSL